MKILILGGTGAMGRYLIELLASQGYSVDVTTRQDLKSEKLNVTYIRGNAHDLFFLENLLKKSYDVIVDFMVYNQKEFKERVDIFLSATKHYIFLSSSRVYSNDNIITEKTMRLLESIKDQDYLLTDEYALSKARQEDLLEKSGKQNWTIVRPYITYSDERLQMGVYEKENWLYRGLQGKTIIFPKDVSEKYTTLTYGYDVAKVILNLIGNNKALGKSVHITTSESLLWKDVIDIYSKIIEKRLGQKLKIKFSEDLEGISKVLNCKYQLKYDRLFNRQFDNSLIDKIIGEKIKYTKVEEGLIICLDNFLINKKKFKDINWKFEGYQDRIANEKTNIMEIKGVKNKIKYFLYRYFPLKFNSN